MCESAKASISACEQVITGYKLSASAQERHVNPHGSVQNRTREVQDEVQSAKHVTLLGKKKGNKTSRLLEI